MKRRFPVKSILITWLFLTALSAPHVRAFSLLGPLESWMTTANGFTPPNGLGGPTLIGGPQALGNGYRWNVPVVTYGFDQSFVDYFGTNGVAAVASAINVFNTLPPASQLVPANYPLNSLNYNYAAQALGLVDLKSTTLFLLLEHLGLAAPDQYAFNIHQFVITNGAVDALVVQRNYDPITDHYSSSVNGNLLAYIATYSVLDGITYAALGIFTVDPYGSSDSAVADGLFALSPGVYYSGLTADDVGGLAYLYSPNNINFEFLPPGVQAAAGGSFVNGALRLGVNKVTFVPQPVDPVTGAFLAATNQFTDTYVTNGQVCQQLLARVTTQPDFIFSATDLVATTAWFDRTGTTNWVNTTTGNGLVSGGGPGVIQSPVRIAFNKFGSVWESAPGTSENAAAEQLPVYWGIFDGTTNAPVSYPTASNLTNATPVRLTLMVNHQAINFRWQITDPWSIHYWLETSTNLNGGWQPLFVIPLSGSVSSYINLSPASAQRFYQLVPDPFVVPLSGSVRSNIN